jgi:hypothetical protein
MYALQQSCAILVKGLALDLYSIVSLIDSESKINQAWNLIDIRAI